MTSANTKEDLPQLYALAERLHKKVEIRDRVYRFRKYKRCFIGEEAVSCLLESGEAATEEQAVALGNAMLRNGILHHVLYEHPFKNKFLFYRFAMDDAPAKSTNNAMLDLLRPAINRPPSNNSATSTASGNPSAATAAMARQLVQQPTMQAPRGAFLGCEVTKLQQRIVRVERELERALAHHNKVRQDLDQRLYTGAERVEKLEAANTALVSELRAQVADFARHSRLSQVLQALQCTALAALALTSASGLPPSPQLLRTMLLLCAVAVLIYVVYSTFAGPRPQADAPVTVTEPPKVVSRTASALGTLLRHSPSSSKPVQEQEAEPLQCHAWSAELQDPPDPEDFVGWPDSPVMLRSSPRATDQVVYAPDDPHGRFRLGVPEPLEFETDLFQGRALFYLKDLRGGDSAALFAGKKRQSWLVIQGKFKQPMSARDVVTGQEFNRRWRNLPAEWFVERIGMKLARSISSIMEIGPLSEPSMLAPMLNIAQIVNVAREGEEPSMMDAQEDMRLHDPTMVDRSGQPWSPAKRRSHFSDCKALSAAQFDTEHVWTFHIWQQFINLAEYKLELPMSVTFNLLRHMNGQPLQFMAKQRGTSSYLFNFDVWHKGLLDEACLSSSSSLTGAPASLRGPSNSQPADSRPALDRQGSTLSAKSDASNGSARATPPVGAAAAAAVAGGWQPPAAGNGKELGSPAVSQCSPFERGGGLTPGQLSPSISVDASSKGGILESSSVPAESPSALQGLTRSLSAAFGNKRPTKEK